MHTIQIIFKSAGESRILLSFLPSVISLKCEDSEEHNEFCHMRPTLPYTIMQIFAFISLQEEITTVESGIPTIPLNSRWRLLIIYILVYLISTHFCLAKLILMQNVLLFRRPIREMSFWTMVTEITGTWLWSKDLNGIFLGWNSLSVGVLVLILCHHLWT